MFTLKNAQGIVLILVYVDDIIVTGSNVAYILKLLSVLSTRIAMQDLGSLHYFLGIEVHQDGDKLLLSQAKHVADLLRKAGMNHCKPSFSLSSVKLGVLDPDPPFSNPHWFRTVVGSLQYLTLTRPDISFAS